MSFLNRNKRNIPPNATFRLTQQGQEKVQEFNGDPKSLVLTALETGGTSDLDEIAHTSGLSRGQVEKYIPALTRGGYIQYVSASSSED